jgi:hypothetical protein
MTYRKSSDITATRDQYNPRFLILIKRGSNDQFLWDWAKAPLEPEIVR